MNQILIQKADKLLKKLYPLCRSITGEGMRETLRELRRVTDFQLREVSSGTKCYDWIVPDEWNVRGAYVQDSRGHKVIDFEKNNVHLVSYSVPLKKTVSFKELSKHISTIPELPEAIPYRTLYYKRDWGFCMRHRDFLKLDKKDVYHVVIDSSLKKGSLSYGEHLIKGKEKREILVSTYACHPSLANDNLSGVVLWTLLLEKLKKLRTRFSYRFVVIPETIGAIAYLSLNEKSMKNVEGCFVVTTVAGPGPFGYKETFLKDHLMDRVVRRVFKEKKISYKTYPFDASGSDERQYSSPAFRIPCVSICKDKYYEYPYYHTSLDNLEFINPKYLVQTLDLHLSAIKKLEEHEAYRSLNPHGEPMLGKRGLYPGLGGGFLANGLDALLWLMFYGDGQNSILDVSEKTGIPLGRIRRVANILERHRLIRKISR